MPVSQNFVLRLSLALYCKPHGYASAWSLKRNTITKAFLSQHLHPEPDYLAGSSICSVVMGSDLRAQYMQTDIYGSCMLQNIGADCNRAKHSALRVIPCIIAVIIRAPIERCLEKILRSRHRRANFSLGTLGRGEAQPSLKRLAIILADGKFCRTRSWIRQLSLKCL